MCLCSVCVFVAPDSRSNGGVNPAMWKGTLGCARDTAAVLLFFFSAATMTHIEYERR